MRAGEESYAGLEAAARRQNAKGVFFDRGDHAQEKDMTDWLNGLDMRDGEFACQQVHVCSCQDCPNAIHDASAQLVADLPTSFRAAVLADAEAMAGACVRLCPDVPWLTLRLEVVQYNACWRWHQDYYTSRAILTYVGPGTCAAEDRDVRWEQFDLTAGQETNDSCVPRKGVRRMRTNAVLLMKGTAWPGILGKGLTHKSPDVRGSSSAADDSPPKRLILKVDLNYNRPMLESEYSESDSDSDSESDSELNETHEVSSEHDDRVSRPAILKRLATSTGFQSARAWKRNRRRR